MKYVTLTILTVSLDICLSIFEVNSTKTCRIKE